MRLTAHGRFRSCSLSRSRFSSREGFTLIELLIVALILGLTAGIALPKVFAAIEKTKYEKAVAEMNELENQVEIYASTHDGELPDEWSDLGQGAIPNDPWGNPYVYKKHTSGLLSTFKRTVGLLIPINTTYDLYSLGPDGQTAMNILLLIASDDVIRGDDGAYLGKAEDY